jgi:NodT family efflux transporter outer membrane factor (OMF) lipoprotein
MKSHIIALGLCTIFCACTLGPDFQPPPPPAIPAFNHSAPGTSMQSDPAPDWWNGFNDPVLQQLMRAVIAGNPSLQEALLRVEEAHQNTAIEAAQGLPTLGASGSYMREQEGLKGLAQSAGAYNQLNALANAADAASPGAGGAVYTVANGALDKLNEPINLYQYELSSSWELDLFGRVRRSVEAARAGEQEAQDAARDSLVMLESQAAQAYFQLRAAQASLAQQQQIVDDAQLTLQLTLSQAHTGLAPQTDVDQARTEFLTAQGQVPTYEKAVDQSLDQIDILAGEPPGALDNMLSPAAPLPDPPALIGAGVPATLARRRPDIREAEDSLHQATAQIGVAVASFYPDISLTGSLGYHALDASYLTNWANLFYSFGPSISLPIFEGGKLAANLRTARISQASAALQYRAAVLNALAEVENALVAYRSDAQTYSDAQATAQSAADNYNLAQSRYIHGLDSFLPALDAERTYFSSQQQAVQARAQVDEDVASLYTALGGGWQETEQAPQVPQIDPAPPVAPAAFDSVAP